MATRRFMVLVLSAVAALLVVPAAAQGAPRTIELDAGAAKVAAFQHFPIVDPAEPVVIAADVDPATGEFTAASGDFDFPLYASSNPNRPPQYTIDLVALENLSGSIDTATGQVDFDESDFDVRIGLPDFGISDCSLSPVPLALSTEAPGDGGFLGDRFETDLAASPPITDGALVETWTDLPDSAQPGCGPVNSYAEGAGEIWLANGLDQPQIAQRTLTATVSGNGTVFGMNPPCTSVCTESYDHGNQRNLWAAPAQGQAFLGWGGACAAAGTNPGCSLTMDADKSVTAQFSNIPPKTLSVTVSGGGSGVVNGQGINCPGDCSEPFFNGQTTFLSADADPGSAFAGWSGACSGTGACTPLMTADRSVGATFVPRRIVAVAIAGSGRVEGQGIDCPGDCSQSYAQGRSVTLQATPGSGFSFTGWSGPCSGAGGCTFAVPGADATVGATFAVPAAQPVTPAPVKKKKKKKRKKKKRK